MQRPTAVSCSGRWHEALLEALHPCGAPGPAARPGLQSACGLHAAGCRDELDEANSCSSRPLCGHVVNANPCNQHRLQPAGTAPLCQQAATTALLLTRCYSTLQAAACSKQCMAPSNVYNSCNKTPNHNLLTCGFATGMPLHGLARRCKAQPRLSHCKLQGYQFD